MGVVGSSSERRAHAHGALRVAAEELLAGEARQVLRRARLPRAERRGRPVGEGRQHELDGAPHLREEAKGALRGLGREGCGGGVEEQVGQRDKGQIR